MLYLFGMHVAQLVMDDRRGSNKPFVVYFATRKLTYRFMMYLLSIMVQIGTVVPPPSQPQNMLHQQKAAPPTPHHPSALSPRMTENDSAAEQHGQHTPFQN